MKSSCKRYRVQPGLPGSAGYVTIRGRKRELPATPGKRIVEICRRRDGKLVMIDATGGRILFRPARRKRRR